MKNEEFNEFLRNKAKEFEVKPSSGSFDEVMRKSAKNRANRGLKVWLPMAAAVVAGLVVMFAYNYNAGVQTTETQTAKGTNSTEAENQSVHKSQHETAPAPQQSNTADAAIDNATDSPQDITAHAATNKNIDNSAKQGRNVTKTITKQDATTTNDEPLPTKADDNVIAEVPKGEVLLAAQDDTTLKIVNDETPLLPDDGIEIAGIALPDSNMLMVDAPPQNTNTEIKKEKKCFCNSRVSVSAYYSPLNVQVYHTQQGQPVNQNTGTGNNGLVPSGISNSNYTVLNEEKLLAGSEQGVKVNIRIKGPWGITTGIALNHWGVSQQVRVVSKQSDSVEQYMIDTVTNTQYTYYTKVSANQTVQNKEYIISNSNIQLPLMANYTFGKRRWAFDVQAGMVFSYLYKSVIKESNINTLVSVMNADSYKQTHYRTFNMQASLGTFVSYKPLSCLGVYAGPRASAALLSYNVPDAGESKKYPVYLGFEAGVKINL